MPLTPGQKGCKDDEWQKLIFRASDFKPGDNIGIRSVNGLVVSDADSPEAVALSAKFLPPTGAIWGRPGKPSAKRLYRSSLEKTIAWKETQVDSSGKKSMILELRANHQDMAPPSVHPEGEQLSWTGAIGEVAEVAPEELLRAHRMLVTAASVMKYYAPPGSRHDWSLALVGTLRQIGLTEQEVIKIFEAQSAETKLHDRLQEVRTTFARSDDDPIAGPKKLAEITSEQFVALLRKTWGVDSQNGGLSLDQLESLNAKHAVLFQQSGDLVVITEDKDAVTGHVRLRFSSLETMRQLYPEQIVVGFTGRNSPIFKKRGQAWLDSPRRRFYNGIELAPGTPLTDGYYNLWQGFSVEPKRGDWSLFRKHIRDVICSGSDELEKYVLAWLAQAVQFPGRPAQTALALRGGQGTGKSTFVRWFGELFGPHFLHLDSTRHLTGNFNAHLHDAILVFADEAAWPGDKAGLGSLRRMITEETLSIERKGMDIMTVKNMVHLMLASNEEWIVPAALDERRFAVFDVAKTHQNDRPWFTAIQRELHEGGGLAALLYDLLEMKLDDVNLRVVPKTKALLEQKRITSSPQLKWWYQVLQDGDWWQDPTKESKIDREAVYVGYCEAVDKVGNWRNSKGLQTELGLFLRKVMFGTYPRIERKGTTKIWVLPSLRECRRCYEEKFSAKVEWDAENTQNDPKGI